jgi:uncharacterized protein (DUF697 family)
LIPGVVDKVGDIFQREPEPLLPALLGAGSLVAPLVPGLVDKVGDLFGREVEQMLAREAVKAIKMSRYARELD